MPDATAVAAAPEPTTPARAEVPVVDEGFSFLTRLVEHGEKLVAADLPTDVRKVLGALVDWVDAGGKFTEPAIFNPAGEQLIYEEQAESARLAARLAQVEQLLANMAAPPAPAAPVVPPAPAAQDTVVVPPAAPVAPAAAPAAPAIPGIGLVPPVAPTPPVSE